MTRQLVPEHEQVGERLAASGGFTDADAVIGEALRLHDERQRRQAWLEAALQVGLDQIARGQTIDVTPEWIEDVKRRAIGAALSDTPMKDDMFP